MSLKLQYQKLTLELPNLSYRQLDCLREDTERTRGQIKFKCHEWKDIIKKYKASWDSINTLAEKKIDQAPGLIKLTDFLYVEGTIRNTDKVMIKIGEGYFVRTTLEGAKGFLERRGGVGIKLAAEGEEMLARKRMIFYAVVHALNTKIQAKIDKLQQMNHNTDETETEPSVSDDLAIQY